MQEKIEFRLSNKYAHLILKQGEGKVSGSNIIIRIKKDDPRFEKIGILYHKIKETNNDFLFLYSEIKRTYTKKELDGADFLHLKIKNTFEPAGEECGTIYDDSVACEICGANRKQVGYLRLKRGSIPNKDIARTISGEVVVSNRLADAIKENIKGVYLEPIIMSKGKSEFFKLVVRNELELGIETIAGINIFDFSEESEKTTILFANGQYTVIDKEVYKCPKGHTIGLNILSELFILSSSIINGVDLFSTRQKVGVKRGLLRPETLYICSQNFRRIIEEGGFSGFEFEVAYISQ